MLGRLEFVSGKRNRRRVEDLYGLPVLRIETDPEGRLGAYRLNKAGASLSRGGVRRVLLPGEFADWETLDRFGLRPVDPTPFLHFFAPELAVKGLRRGDIAPERATVVLGGNRVDHAMVRAAVRLCPCVRRLAISAPGGERLALHLREEFGIPVLPPEEPGHMGLNFHPGGMCREERCLNLYGRRPDLDGGKICAPTLGEGEKENLPLLCALWEGGKLDVEGLKFT